MDHVEEMSLESLRKMQDVQMVVMSETAGKATKGRGEYAWRLEPEGETEMPETRVVSDGVEGVHVDSNGEGPHEREQVEKFRRQSEAPGEEGGEISEFKVENTPPGPTPLCKLGSIPNNWADVCGFLKPPDSDRY